MKKFKRLLASFVAVLTLLAINPVGANAEWKENNNSWWYTEGNSYATGWRLIDGNWYYFNSDGYMAKNTTIDGYYLGNGGTWTNSMITLEEAKQIALDRVKAVRYHNIDANVVIVPYFDIDEKVIEGRNGYIITIGEDTIEHTVPTARVFVDKHTGEVFDAFNYVFDIDESKLKELV